MRYNSLRNPTSNLILTLLDGIMTSASNKPMHNIQMRMFGTWDSVITAESVALNARIGDAAWDSDGKTLVWTESRQGATWLMAKTGQDSPRFLTDGNIPVRGRIGYGGGDFTVAGGVVYFVGHDRRVFSLPLAGGVPHPITPPFGAAAAPTISPDGRFLIFAHHHEGVDGLAVVDVDGRQFPRKLAYDADFVMQPAWHPSGSLLAYVIWNHPQMPFDGTQLIVAQLQETAGLPAVVSTSILAGGPDTAIFQPAFSPDGRKLAYVSDETGWWQIYIYDLETKQTRQITDVPAEHAAPAWAQGMRTIGWSPSGDALYFLRSALGKSRLGMVELTNGTTREVRALEHYDSMRQIAVSPTYDEVALIAASTTTPDRLVSIEIDRLHIPPALSLGSDDSGVGRIAVIIAEQEVIHARSRSEMLRDQIAPGQPVEWTGHDGETVYGWYYPPFNARCRSSGAPPLIVRVHGGPTGQSRQNYAPETHFFTTRGYALLDVNHRGSTGYGKAYKDKLRGMWGVYDVEDSASGALALVERGLADRSKLIILGGSAGGYTVLQSLATKPGLYAAGVCLYGISNQFLLSFNDAWKFEARYNDTLLGTLPESTALFRERSPLFHADKISDPLIIFHGEDDEAVPISQAEVIVKALRRRGVPHEYHVYKGEGHGWHKSETIIHYLKATIDFLQQIVIFK
ncbi:MAG: prolyl oligopeptidase family serine peptidase [Anaerolineae bacterium]|nr:prolyl oligopeptidase family serine peptidase [Anaerolineae bacterium]NUQ03754.1 prolyl oligopeptidase family serine peptidase [Anaerolineae bacterium]